MAATERTTVWVICEDGWEWDTPLAAFTTKALADEHCAALNATTHNVHQVVALPLLDKTPVTVTWHHHQRSVYPDGSTRRWVQSPREGWDYEHGGDPALLICEPRGSTVANIYATDPDVAEEACEAAAAEIVERYRATLEP